MGKMLENEAANDATLRRNLFLVFGKAKNPKAVVPISKWLGTDSLEASNALIAIGQQSEDHMLRIVDTSSDTHLKLQAIHVLGRIGGQNSTRR